MNPADDLDTILAGWFHESAPTTVPDGLHSDVIDRARTARQHLRWGAVLRDAGSRPAARPVVRLAWLAVAVTAILVASLALSGLPAAVVPPIATPTPAASGVAVASPTPSQIASPASAAIATPPLSRMTDIFSVPFVYTIPVGSDLTPIGTREEVIAFADGMDLPPDSRRGPGPAPVLEGGVVSAFGGEDPDSGKHHGVIVAPVMEAWGHGNAGRVALRSNPADFLSDLGSILPGVHLERVTTATLDGRPALTTRTARRDSDSVDSDMHFGSIRGLSGLFMRLKAPSQFIVADIEGTTVMVKIWARDEEDFAAWLPVAQTFVDSIHFLPH